MALQEYREKRNFRRTPEPKGGKAHKSGSRFVVQKHHASNLHYDFRLEIAGVLVSWAVPKGPSMNPSEKRLAIRTEDHPLEYRDFEGTIPEEEYGGGTVMLWDEGTVNWFRDHLTRKEMLRKGHLEFELEGQKLKGKFALVRAHFGNEPKTWLLVKMKDRRARKKDVLEEMPNSVRTGRSMDQIAAKVRD